MAILRIPGVVVLLLAAGCTASSPQPTPPPVAAAPVIPPAELPPEQRYENPQYTRWAKYKPGTIVTFREVSQDTQNRTETTVTYTLKDVTDTHAVVEVRAPRKWPDGRVFDDEPQDLKHYRWQRVSTGKGKPADPGRPDGAYADGEESMTAAGRVVKAKWYKYKGRVEAGVTDSQTWFSDAIPGGLVKSVFTVPVTKKTITGELVSIHEPKPDTRTAANQTGRD